jgi:hypothetical protein
MKTTCLSGSGNESIEVPLHYFKVRYEATSMPDYSLKGIATKICQFPVLFLSTP